MGYRRRNILSRGTGARAPRHYSKFVDDAGVRLGLWIIGILVAFLLFVVLLVFV